MVGDALKFYSLFRQAYGTYKIKILILAALGFLSGLLEGIGVNLLIPLFALALGGGQIGNDFITRKIADFFSFFNLPFSVPTVLIFMCLMFLGKAILSVVLDYFKLTIGADYEQQTRRSLFEKILAANWTHLLKQRLGYLETILMVDVPNSANLLGQLAGGLTFATGLVIYVFIALNISAPITLLTLALGLVFFFMFRPILKKIKVLAMERNQIVRETSHHVSENILGMKTVKTMLVEKGVAARGRELFAILRKSTLKVPFLKSITNAAIEPVAAIFIALVFFHLYRTGSLTAAELGALAAIVYLINRIFIYIQQLQRVTHVISDFSAYLQSVVSYEQTAANSREVESPGKPFAFQHNLEFKDVSFAYSDDRPILSNLNLAIKKGEMVGLIGPSGAGKTTLVDIVLRLFRPKSGVMLLDGRDAREIDMDDWRRHIGYVSQDIFLMNDTIANNIRFYNFALTQGEIEFAARQAAIHEFIVTLPEKYETMIGERGIRLSGGERQRVVLARILARQPDVLILDEATSSLDNESEAQIQRAIKSLKGQITVLAIAHRLSTVMDSDRLLVLEDGKLIEEGEPKKLLEDKSSYFFRSYNIITS